LPGGSYAVVVSVHVAETEKEDALIMQAITVAVFALKLYPHGKEMKTLSASEVIR
jgi:hypothetical protein